MKPIVLALQYWSGDRDRAFALADQIASSRLAPSPNTFVLVSRFDAEPPPEELLARLRRKFARAEHVRSTTRLTGHPDGAWALWKDTLGWFRSKGSDHLAVLTFESDCTPLWPDFDQRLQLAFGRLPGTVFMAGHHWTGARAPWGDHVNGNCMVRYDEAKLDRVLAAEVPTGRPWDLHLYPLFLDLGVLEFPSIRSLYGKKFSKPFFDVLRAGGAALQHGDKDGSLQEIAKAAMPAASGYPIRVRHKVPDTPMAPSTGWHVDSDDVPSILEQAPVPWAEIKPPPLGDELASPGTLFTRFNGSMCATRDSKFAFAYRRQACVPGVGMEAWKSDVVWMESVDPFTGTCLGATRLLGLSPRGGSILTHFEDPRLSPGEVPGELRLSYAEAAYPPDPNPGVTQCSLLVDRAGNPLSVTDRSSAGENLSPHAWEKNWAWFPGSQRFLYSLYPRVESYNPPTHAWTSRETTAGLARWSELFGHPRGGTNPLLVPELGGYLVAFHSHVKHPTRKRRYHAGWAVIDAGDFSVLRSSAQPFLTASARDGFAWPVGSRPWEPLVVFPMSLGRVGDELLLTLGVNDSRMFVMRFPVGLVAASLPSAR